VQVVIVGEFCHVELFTPVILLVIAEHADIGLDPLVIVFHLSLCLWVVCCGEALVNMQGLEELSGVVCCECGPSVCIVDLRNTMQFPHVSQV
jgi:hypothetical protein